MPKSESSPATQARIEFTAERTNFTIGIINEQTPLHPFTAAKIPCSMPIKVFKMAINKLTTRTSSPDIMVTTHASIGSVIDSKPVSRNFNALTIPIEVPLIPLIPAIS